MRMKHDSDDIVGDIVVTKKRRQSEACFVCDKEFSSVSTLNRHLKNQHKVEPLETGRSGLLCPLCDAKFPSSTSMDVHLEKAHGMELSSSHKTFENLDGKKNSQLSFEKLYIY